MTLFWSSNKLIVPVEAVGCTTELRIEFIIAEFGPQYVETVTWGESLKPAVEVSINWFSDSPIYALI